MLDGASDDLRSQVISTIGNIGDESSVPAIVGQCNLTPVVPNVHRLAILALANSILKSYPPNPQLNFTPGQPQSPPRVLAQKDTDAAKLAEPIFIQTLADVNQDNFARARSAQALGRIGGTLAAQHLVAALSDYDSRVVSSATSGLAEAGPPAVTVMKAAIGSPNIQVRTGIASALGSISDPTALSAIQPMLHDANSGVRQAAVTALGIRANPASIALLLPILSDPNGIVASSATEALHRIGAPAIPSLISLIGSPDQVKALSASNALRSIGVTAQPAVLTALSSGTDTQRAWAAFTLGQLQDYAAVPQLQEVAAGTMPHAKYAAQQALQQLGHV
jgi:HEAT repeat protein